MKRRDFLKYLSLTSVVSVPYLYALDKIETLPVHSELEPDEISLFVGPDGLYKTLDDALMFVEKQAKYSKIKIYLDDGVHYVNPKKGYVFNNIDLHIASLSNNSSVCRVITSYETIVSFDYGVIIAKNKANISFSDLSFEVGVSNKRLKEYKMIREEGQRWG